MSRDPYADLPQVDSFELSSRDVSEGRSLDVAQVSGVLGAGGQDVSPHLAWSGAPAGTRSYAVTVYDPDAPTASAFWHWAAFDIPADVHELATGASSTAMPHGSVELTNDSGRPGFVGAAPPPGHGVHHYWIVVHAVDVAHLDLPASASPAKLGFTLFDHTLGRAALVPIYEVEGGSSTQTS